MIKIYGKIKFNYGIKIMKYAEKWLHLYAKSRKTYWFVWKVFIMKLYQG